MRQRLKLRLEFDGAGYCGWQLQSEGPEYVGPPSLQATLERSIATILHRAGERVPVQGCGRTDTGVHAEEFYAHCDLPLDVSFSDMELEKFRHRLNCVLPDGLVVTDCVSAPGFDAIRQVTEKTYEYRILLRRAKPVLLRGRVHWISVNPADPTRFDVEKIRQHIKIFEGEHDFVAFAAANHTAKSTRREILKADCLTETLFGDDRSGLLVRLRFTGRGFLKQMVRTLAGTLMELAEGRRSPESILALRDGPGVRQSAGFCAPPEGLFLAKVTYRDGET